MHELNNTQQKSKGDKKELTSKWEVVTTIKTDGKLISFLNY